MKRAVTLAIDRGWLLGLVALVVYVALAPAVIVGGDNAEFATLGAVGGVAHPPGYPAYVLWLRAMSWLPGASPAQTAAIATAILAALQLVVLHAACRAWGARPLAASIAVAVYAASPLILRTHTEAEAFAPNGLVVATVLWLAAAAGPLRGARRAAALGLVAGLGLANHLTCALVAPVGILGVVRGVREARAVTTIPAALGGLVAGLLPYAYLFVAPDNVMAWGRPRDLGELVDLFLRRQYGGAAGFMGGDAPVPVARQLAELASTLARSWLWLGAVAGVGMLALRIARPAGETRAGWIVLAASFAIAGPLLATRFDVEPEGLGLYIVHRFHVLPILLLVVPVAAAIDLGAARVKRSIAAGAVACVGFVAIVATSLPELARFHSPAMENGVRGMLRGLPRDAVVLGTTDELDVGFHYLQLARDERTDVVAFRYPPLGVPWYAARFASLGLTGAMSKLDVVDHVLATGRPLFVPRFETEILRAYPGYAYSLFVRVLPRGQAPPPLGEVVELNKKLFEGLDLDYAPPGPDDEFATVMHLRYAQVWRGLARQLAAAGDRGGSAAASELANVLAPR